MSFIAYDHTGKEIGRHPCYSPAEKMAKDSAGSATVLYEGIRGQCVIVWPLPPLTSAVTAEETPYAPDYS
jgi:hypothetical protein